MSILKKTYPSSFVFHASLLQLYAYLGHLVAAIFPLADKKAGIIDPMGAHYCFSLNVPINSDLLDQLHVQLNTLLLYPPQVSLMEMMRSHAIGHMKAQGYFYIAEALDAKEDTTCYLLCVDDKYEFCPIQKDPLQKDPCLASVCHPFIYAHNSQFHSNIGKYQITISAACFENTQEKKQFSKHYKSLQGQDHLSKLLVWGWGKKEKNRWIEEAPFLFWETKLKKLVDYSYQKYQIKKRRLIFLEEGGDLLPLMSNCSSYDWQIEPNLISSEFSLYHFPVQEYDIFSVSDAAEKIRSYLKAFLDAFCFLFRFFGLSLDTIFFQQDNKTNRTISETFAWIASQEKKWHKTTRVFLQGFYLDYLGRNHPGPWIEIASKKEKVSVQASCIGSLKSFTAFLIENQPVMPRFFHPCPVQLRIPLGLKHDIHLEQLCFLLDNAGIHFDLKEGLQDEEKLSSPAPSSTFLYEILYSPRWFTGNAQAVLKDLVQLSVVEGSIEELVLKILADIKSTLFIT